MAIKTFLIHEVDNFLENNSIDKKYRKHYFQKIQEAKKGFPEKWVKTDSHKYILSLHKQVLELKMEK